MSKPIVVISAAQEYSVGALAERYVLNKNYAGGVLAGGGVPILAVDPTSPAEYVALGDGLILTGAWPVHPDPTIPGIFNMREEKGAFTSRLRNPEELDLFRAFRDAGKPILGICRGHQYINIGQGGNLNTGIARSYGREHREGFFHPVKTEPGSILAKLYGEEFFVNSHHNFHIDRLGEGIKVTAWSADGLPEALEHESLPIIGLQWHPERMRGDHPHPPKGPDMTSLFAFLVEWCLQIKGVK
ncbi:MAG: gamma-glutamyl-gamma-aminobutyrate hydrolase family protein [Symbiobacteriaceae bacterium]|nr:gamma-glutamyl-gamma-aminobutyrate hydrolase family protein [Symbiobacteriaceae bacterium]